MLYYIKTVSKLRILSVDTQSKFEPFPLADAIFL